jgi:hypothetical protein
MTSVCATGPLLAKDGPAGAEDSVKIGVGEVTSLRVVAVQCLHVLEVFT